MCMEFPIRFNPIRDTSVKYHHEAVIESSIIDMQAASLYKYFNDMTLRTQNLGAGTKVILEYKVNADIEDTTAEWTNVGEFLVSPKGELHIRRGEVTKIRLRLRLLTDDCDKPPIIEAWDLQGYSRTPLKYQYHFWGDISTYTVTMIGGPDAAPEDLISFLKESAIKARVLTMKSSYDELNGVRVIMGPPTVTYKDALPIVDSFGADYHFVAREA